jgi:hypothetical protein
MLCRRRPAGGDDDEESGPRHRLPGQRRFGVACSLLLYLGVVPTKVVDSESLPARFGADQSSRPRRLSWLIVGLVSPVRPSVAGDPGHRGGVVGRSHRGVDGGSPGRPLTSGSAGSTRKSRQVCRTCPPHPARSAGPCGPPILAARRRLKRGPHQLAPILGHPRSTIYAVLRHQGLSRLTFMDRPTAIPIRYERGRPGGMRGGQLSRRLRHG